MNKIPYTKERCLKAALSELVDDYESLKKEVRELRDHNSYLESCLDDRNDEMMHHVRLFEKLQEAVKDLLHAQDAYDYCIVCDDKAPLEIIDKLNTTRYTVEVLVRIK